MIRSKGERLLQLSELTSSKFSPTNFAVHAVQNAFDVVIITQQLDTKLAKKGFFATMKSLWREEGFRAYTKGLWTSILQQFVDDKARSFLRRLLWATLPNYLPPLAIESLIAAIAHTIVYPLQAIRTRLIAQTGTAKYTGMFDCFVRAREEEGDAALFTQGLLPSLAQVLVSMVASSYSTRFLIHPVLRRIESQHGWILALPLGTIATEFFTHPIATITKRMQLQFPGLPHSMQPRVTGSSVMEVVSSTRQKQGITALWSGFTGVIVRSFAVSATMALAVLIDDLATIVRENYGDAYAMVGLQ